MAIAFRYAAKSDIGLTRQSNQDSGYAGPHLLVVADGMGGHAGGDIASSLTVAKLSALDGEAVGPNALSHLAHAVEAAHEDIADRVEAEPELAGMGTTVTAILRSGSRLALAHIGDSRGYLLRGDDLIQVTSDHSYVQYLVQTGKITPEEAEVHPQRNVVLRVLGDVEVDMELDVSVREARAGDRWLLCSDGLSGVLSHETIQEVLTEDKDVDICAEHLIQLTLKGGAPDNVTCVVADVVDLEDFEDGEAPDTVPQIVGSAAIDRFKPTQAGDGPAARAAALTDTANKNTTESDLEESGEAETELIEEEQRADRRHRRRRTGLILVIIAALLAVGGYVGWRWTQTQYYIGEGTGSSVGRVVIYRGIPQSIGPISFSEVVETEATLMTELSDPAAERVRQTIPVDSLEDGQKKVDELPLKNDGP